MAASTIPPIHDVDLRLLRVFKVVVECGGFAASVETLGIGRSTISTHVADLEMRLGLRLCERGRAGFFLTDHGRAVYEAAISVFTSLDRFRKDVGHAKGRLTGELRLWSMDETITDARSPVVEATGRFKQRADDVRLVLNVASCAEVEKAVYYNRADIGITMGRSDLAGLVYQSIYDEDTMLYCSNDHVLFDIADITPDRLSDQDYVSRGYLTSGDHLLCKWCRSTAVGMKVESTLHLILTGRYIGYLPTHVAEPWERLGRLKALLPPTARLTAPVYLISRVTSSSDRVISLFVEELLRASVG